MGIVIFLGGFVAVAGAGAVGAYFFLQAVKNMGHM